MVEEALKPIEKEINQLQEQANVSATRAAYTFLGGLCVQFLLSQYGTYYAFSWDIIEPITACVSLSDAVAAYFFRDFFKHSWELNGVRGYFFDRRLKKLMKKNNINEAKYNELLQVRQTLQQKLNGPSSN